MEKISHVIFFDDACPLCNSEIKHYKAIESLHHIEWLGIYQNWDQISPYGISRERLLRRIHAVHSNGTVLTGAAVFVLIWNSLRYYHLLGRFVSTFHLVPVLDFFYKYFADWRYKKNQHCRLDRNQT